MNSKVGTVGLTLAFAMLGGAASAQLLYSQPYTPKQSSFESRVGNCAEHRPFKRQALDDWIATVNSPVTKIEWWGTLTNPAQASKMFFVAIYKHDPATNKPAMGSLIAQRCVVPQAVYVGTDCKGMRVFKFTAKFAVGWFNQTAGQHYWLNVSESDKESAKQLVEDFRWSGRRPIKNAPAVQFTSAGTFIPSLVDVCDNLRDDLSFNIYRS